MDPAAISTGMGEGMAQIFKPQEDFLGEAMKAAEAKKKESAANKSKAMETLGKMAEYHVWTERDGAEFAKKQKEVWDGLQGKDLDDPNTMLWLNQKQQELTYLADLSNTAKEQYINGTKTYQQGGDKYFSDVVDRMQEFANPANALNKNITWNPGWFMEDPNIDKRISELAKENIATAEANKKQKASVGAIPGSDGREFVKETLTQEFSLDDAKNQVRTLLTSPAFNKAAEIKWNQDPNKANYNSVYDWAEAVYAPKLANESRIENVSQLSTGGAGAGAGASSPYGLTRISTETAVLSPEEITKNPTLASTVVSDPKFKTAYEEYKKSWNASTPEARQQAGLGDKLATAEEYAARVLPKEGKVIPISRLNPTGEPVQAREMLFETGKGANTPAIMQGFFDYNGKLMVMANVEKEPAKFGKPAVYETKYFPLTSTNYKKIVNEYSDPKAKLDIEDYLVENGYGDQIKQFQVTTTGGAKPTTSTTTTGATPTTATKPTAGGTTAATQTTSNQYGGDWNDEWTKAILAHERAVGAPGGKSFTSGYNDDEWLGKKAGRNIVKEYVSEVKKQLPEYSSLPDAFKIRLVDYKFNSGRDPRVAILEGLGLIKGDITYKGSDGKDKTTSIRTYLHNEGKADVDKYWNKNKTNIDMSDPATMKAFDDARTEITKATNKPGTVLIDSKGNPHVVTQEEYEGNINKNQLPRITLADQIVANKPTTNVKRDATGKAAPSGTQPVAPIKGKATGSVLTDYAPDVQLRIKAVMAANNIDEKTAIQALKDAKKIK